MRKVRRRGSFQHFGTETDKSSVSLSIKTEVVSTHEAFHSILDRALSAHDRVIREEETKASALLKVRGAMDSLEQLFNKAKEFYVTEPSRDASAAVCFMYGNQAFQDTVDENSLQDVLIQTAAKDPRLMLNVQRNISTMRDCPNLQHLMTMLIEGSNRIHSILNTREDKIKIHMSWSWLRFRT